MSRFAASGETSAALANNTKFGFLQPTATQGFRLRRMTLSSRLTTGVAVASSQIQVQILRNTSAGTTPSGTVAPVNLDLVKTTSTIVGPGVATAFVTAPTTVATPIVTLNFNSQSGIDMPFEGLEEVLISAAVTDGLTFLHNSGAALAANQVISWGLEWEE